MSKPVDIKIAHINPVLNDDQSLDKDAVWDVFQNNNNEVVKHILKFQQTWVNQAYKVFKDFDAYLVLLYLINKVFMNMSDRFHYMTFENFYNQEKLSIDKINLIEISKDLNIPKETIRRKVNFLQKKEIIYRSGKSIYCNVSKFDIQKPVTSIGLLSQVLSKFSIFLSKEKWFGKELSNEQIIKFIHEHFTVSWEYFFRFQIPYLVRHRTYFGDIETWNVWGSIGVVQAKEFIEKSQKQIIDNPSNFKDLWLQILKNKVKRGINASSISDISGIPRATVIRKLKALQERKLVSRNKNLEYTLSTSQHDFKGFEQNYLINQKAFSDYATTMYNLMKFSKLKIN